MKKRKTDMVVAGYLIHNSKVLLIHHKKLNLWLPPGGHIEENETPDDALKREFREEVGIDIEIINRNDMPKAGNIIKQLAVPFYVNVHNVGDHDHCCLFYLCKPKTPKIKENTKEINNFKWFSKEDLSKVPEDVKNIALKAFDILSRTSPSKS